MTISLAKPRTPRSTTDDRVGPEPRAATLAWALLGLGGRLRRAGRPGTRQLWAIGAAWSLPLGLGPSLFSSDVYSYMAQGMILHLGHSPYHDAPAVLAHLGTCHCGVFRSEPRGRAAMSSAQRRSLHL